MWKFFYSITGQFVAREKRLKISSTTLDDLDRISLARVYCYAHFCPKFWFQNQVKSFWSRKKDKFRKFAFKLKVKEIDNQAAITLFICQQAFVQKNTSNALFLVNIMAPHIRLNIPMHDMLAIIIYKFIKLHKKLKKNVKVIWWGLLVTPALQMCFGLSFIKHWFSLICFGKKLVKNNRHT